MAMDMGLSLVDTHAEVPWSRTSYEQAVSSRPSHGRATLTELQKNKPEPQAGDSPRARRRRPIPCQPLLPPALLGQEWLEEGAAGEVGAQPTNAARAVLLGHRRGTGMRAASTPANGEGLAGKDGAAGARPLHLRLCEATWRWLKWHEQYLPKEGRRAQADEAQESPAGEQEGQPFGWSAFGFHWRAKADRS